MPDDLSPAELRRVRKALRAAHAKGVELGRAEGRREAATLLEYAARLNGSTPHAVAVLKGIDRRDQPAGGPGSANTESAPDPAGAEDADPLAALGEAMLAHAEESLAAGDDPAPGLGRLRELADDPGRLAEVLAAGGADAETVGKCWLVLKAGKYDESKHPRDDKGRYVSKDAIADAKGDPKAEAKLREKVTDPAQRKKLDAALSGETDLGRTKRGQASHEAAGRRTTREEGKAKTAALLKHLAKVGDLKAKLTADHLHELADHLQSGHPTVEDVRAMRRALGGAGAGRVSFGGARRKADMVAALVNHARGKAFDARVKEQGFDAEEMRSALAPAPEPAAATVESPAVEPTLQELETGVRPGGGRRAQHADPMSRPYRREETPEPAVVPVESPAADSPEDPPSATDLQPVAAQSGRLADIRHETEGRLTRASAPLEGNRFSGLEDADLAQRHRNFVTQIAAAKRTLKREGDTTPAGQQAKAELEKFGPRFDEADAEFKRRIEVARLKRRVEAIGESEKTGKLTVTESEMRELLGQAKDAYREAGLRGRVPYSPEHFKTSDLTGAKVRHFVELPNGQIAHPDELTLAQKRGRLQVIPDAEKPGAFATASAADRVANPPPAPKPARPAGADDARPTADEFAGASAPAGRVKPKSPAPPKTRGPNRGEESVGSAQLPAERGGDPGETGRDAAPGGATPDSAGGPRAIGRGRVEPGRQAAAQAVAAAPSRFGSAGDAHPLAALPDRRAKLDALSDIIGRMDGSADPSRIGDPSVPPPHFSDALRDDILGVMARKQAEISVPADIAETYAAVGAKHGLTKHDFQRVLAHMDDRGDLRLQDWPRSVDDVPDPEMPFALPGDSSGALRYNVRLRADSVADVERMARLGDQSLRAGESAAASTPAGRVAPKTAPAVDATEVHERAGDFTRTRNSEVNAAARAIAAMSQAEAKRLFGPGRSGKDHRRDAVAAMLDRRQMAFRGIRDSGGTARDKGREHRRAEEAGLLDEPMVTADELFGPAAPPPAKRPAAANPAPPAKAPAEPGPPAEPPATDLGRRMAALYNDAPAGSVADLTTLPTAADVAALPAAERRRIAAAIGVAGADPGRLARAVYDRHGVAHRAAPERDSPAKPARAAKPKAAPARPAWVAADPAASAALDAHAAAPGRAKEVIGNALANAGLYGTDRDGNPTGPAADPPESDSGRTPAQELAGALAAGHRDQHDLGHSDEEREATASLLRELGAVQVGEVGGSARFDGAVHDGPPGAFTGHAVTVTRPGWKIPLGGGRWWVPVKARTGRPGAAKNPPTNVATALDTPTAVGNTTPVPATPAGAPTGGGKMDNRHVVVGDTFKHKGAIREAGGAWDAARKEWTVPAGAELPAGLATRPVAEVRAEDDERAIAADPARGSEAVGREVLRPHPQRAGALTPSVLLRTQTVPVSQKDGTTVPAHVELHSTGSGSHREHEVRVYFRHPKSGEINRLSSVGGAVSGGYNPTHERAAELYAAEMEKADAVFAAAVAKLGGGVVA